MLIVFTCNHCPYAIALWRRLIQLSQHIKPKGINTLAINPNINPNYPDDSPENMTSLVDSLGLPFPYLIDSDQSVARLYEAQCTPDIYLLNHEKQCVYHGRFDDNWQDESQVSSNDLQNAIDNMLQGQSIQQAIPSMGCSIKWNE